MPHSILTETDKVICKLVHLMVRLSCKELSSLFNIPDCQDKPVMTAIIFHKYDTETIYAKLNASLLYREYIHDSGKHYVIIGFVDDSDKVILLTPDGTLSTSFTIDYIQRNGTITDNVHNGIPNVFSSVATRMHI